MKKVGGILRFIKAVIFVLNYAIAAYVVNIFGSGEKFLKSRTGTGAKKLMDITGATITVSGTENIDTNKHYIFVGNHRSYTDILVLFAAGGVAGCHFTFMAKKELFRIPFLGKSMNFLHVIGVERGSTSKAMKSLLEAIEVIKTGRNVVIFPEGTRSNDGHTLSPFKKGAFTIAKRAEVDVIPFVIEGTEKYMPKKGFGMYKADLSIKFYPPISTHDKTDTEIMNEAENVIKEALCQK
ncbi:MAG: lysophospholipid acyltransferase family protein [Mucispirillum sp.]|nr:lysophospholipid acyltransferase family protein [Mucispirillum sp.]